MTTTSGMRRTRVLLSALTVAAAALLAANLVFLLHDEPGREPVHPVFSDLRFNGDNDGAFIELLGHVVLGIAAVVLAVVALRIRSLVLGVWAAIVAVIVADDALTLHERIGTALVQGLGLPAPFGFAPQYLGEALAWVLIGTPLLALLVWAVVRADAAGRRDSRHLAVALAVLAVPVVLVDAAVVLTARFASTQVATATVLVETAGEIAAMLLVLAVALRIRMRRVPASGA